MSIAPPLQHVPLLGRERELRAIDAALERAAHGGIEVILVEAPPGLGKTRLLNEAMHHAMRRNFAVLHADCDIDDASIPFSAVVRALAAVPASSDEARRNLAEVFKGGSSADPHQRFRAADGALSFLDGLLKRTPIALVIDDLQDMDSGSLFVLRQVVRRLADSRLVLILATRPANQAGPASEHIQAQYLELGPLSSSVVNDLTARLLLAQPGRHLRSELAACVGNPLLVIQFVRQIETDGLLERTARTVELKISASPAASGILRRRLASLPEAVMEVLRSASVLGLTFSVGELVAVTDTPARETVGLLAKAKAAGVLVERGDNFAFSHALLHDATYESIPEPARLQMHEAAADALELAHAPAGRIARQLAETHATNPRLVEWLVAAAREVMSRAPEEAAALITRALALDSPPTGRGDLTADLAEALSWCGRLSEASRMGDTALASGLDGPRETQLRAHLARSLRLQGSPAAAYEMAVAGSHQDGTLIAEAALAAVFSQRVDKGRELAKQVLEPGHDDLSRCIALSAYAFGSFLSGDWPLAQEAGAQAVAIGMRSTAVMEIAQPRLYYGHVLTVCCRYGEAEEQLQRGLLEAERAGRRWLEPLYHQFLSRKRWLMGEWDDALAEEETAVAAAEDMARGFNVLLGGPAQAVSIRLHRGLLSEARNLLGQAAPSESDQSPTGGTLTDWQLALVLEAEGRAVEALDVLLAFWRRGLAAGQLVELRQAGPDLVRIAGAAGRPQVAEVVEPVLVTLQARAVHPLADAALLHVRALKQNSLEHCLEAIRLLEPMQRPLELATTYESGARLAGSAGQRNQAVMLAERAEDIYLGLDAEFDLARVRKLLRGVGRKPAGRGPRPPAKTGWASLTRSESEVARLVASGMSNPEAAERLFISRRTVETHLKHVYGKLGITSRLQLAVEAARLS